MFNADCHVGVVYLIMCKPTTLLHATLLYSVFCLYFFNLLHCLNDWTCTILNRHSVAVAYIDFQKAFDSVCHNNIGYSKENLMIHTGVPFLPSLPYPPLPSPSSPRLPVPFPFIPILPLPLEVGPLKSS